MTMLEYVLQQLPYHAPLLAVYLIGFIISLVQLGRHPRPSVIVLVACGLLFLASVLALLAHGYLFSSVKDQNLGFEAFRRWQVVVAAVVSLLHVTGLSLLLVAAFVGRKGVVRDDAASLGSREPADGPGV
ncbi:hypothetical protein GobsT_40820 [Gemmata obscuriglobus]|uniref:hypothetical protein n=1 Tax=Gemmata obscuriglobus TaxID=114 RepID=UPI0011CCF2F6|nr:hypothetical protein [Gemmata obscuriglobus]QEG29287.1 hypothetical protein GobsT_40820 [Gemmata obscuriglobus]VTS08245.1 unnamed protein product [Gemmata obscuriglobus UQM 2246]